MTADLIRLAMRRDGLNAPESFFSSGEGSRAREILRDALTVGGTVEGSARKRIRVALVEHLERLEAEKRNGTRVGDSEIDRRILKRAAHLLGPKS